MSSPGRLREHPKELSVLVARTAQSLGIDSMFVEKDFWVTELLRSVSAGVHVDVAGVEVHVPVVFKGGTSLSRVFGLIDRFSEDVDLLVMFPAAMGMGTRDRALKKIVEVARTHLLLEPESCVTETSTKGVKRNVQFHYPREHAHATAREHLLLEMGSRGGPNPHGPHELRSMVAEYADRELGEGPSVWQEFASVTIEVLAPERTLLEKCALLHNLGTKIVATQDSVALEYMARAGRHYYDVGRPLSDAQVRAALEALGPAGVAELSGNIDEASAAAGWRFETRPTGGYAASAAFDPAAPCYPAAADGYAAALPMVYGQAPSFEEVLATVLAHRALL